MLTTSHVGVDWRRVWRLLVVVVVLLVAAGVNSGYDRECSTHELNGRRAGVCGSRLADLVRVVCRSVYNKRSADCENHSLAPSLSLLTPTTVAGVKRLAASVCLSVCLFAR